MMPYIAESIALAFIFGGICGTLITLHVSGRRYQTAEQRTARRN